MTRAHVNRSEDRLNWRERTGSDMCWRDRAIARVIAAMPGASSAL
jgi:hypothetical protein